MEDGRQVKRSYHTPAASSSAAAGGGGGGESDGERQRREERERVLWQGITDEPGLRVSIVAFLPLYLLVQLSQSIYQQAAPAHTHLTISCGTCEERCFWRRIPAPLVSQLGALLTHLTTIVLRRPFHAALWCLDVFVALVEGHVAGDVQPTWAAGPCRPSPSKRFG
ncbi:unnamed protein product [Vitrella brassicaformis CCMP3155]|uniref:Uncharacterized protein n=1 Tax=Vitrella brassicaformis (strain CCMP3155) TaxID=1169540 RepID=A0A0G4ER67_VITBC|nr:unnamed protein product [Vitrella brassicaformis CCMP3155]|eukprot:CEM00738.1 unnamed protein product [Vitrella brassicaformis CCMP3155]